MYHQFMILLLASLAAISLGAKSAALPEQFTCRSSQQDKAGKWLTHTFKGADCNIAIERLAKGKTAVASCHDCLLGIMGPDGKPFTPEKAVNKQALVDGVQHIIDTCNSSTHSKRDDKKKSPAGPQVVLGLSKDTSKC